MNRLAAAAALAFLAACAHTPRDPQREQLIDRHRQLFTELGVSGSAVRELCDKVAWVYDGIRHTRESNPETFHALEGVTQRGNPRNYDEAMSAHRRRFEALGLSEGTMSELAAAFTGVYNDLHGDHPSERALRIRALMAQLPPCCDDNIFRRAGAVP